MHLLYVHHVVAFQSINSYIWPPPTSNSLLSGSMEAEKKEAQAIEEDSVAEPVEARAMRHP
jgi:hypothetical protein